MLSSSVIFGDAGDTISQALTLSPEASPVRTCPTPASESELTGPALVYGRRCGESFANFDRDSSSWRTSQLCFTGEWSEFSETWPRAGLMRNGTCFPLAPLAPLTSDNEYSLWPTPVANDDNKSWEAHMAMKARMKGGPRYKPTSLQVMAKGVTRGLWPTPQAHDATGARGKNNTFSDNHHYPHDLVTAVKMWPTPTGVTATGGAALCKWGGSGARRKLRTMVSEKELNGALNPTWVEWLMGFPLEWTALKDWATRSSRKSRSGSDEG
jgi:hypothetical protein